MPRFNWFRCNRCGKDTLIEETKDIPQLYEIVSRIDCASCGNKEAAFQRNIEISTDQMK